ncbi:hypothetical protein DEI83_13120 [Curtobacterium sp. MCBD17_021]|nr:hypothetical protein DEI83_13120 [Curtobacterium sp. MCBD17_021]
MLVPGASGAASPTLIAVTARVAVPDRIVTASVSAELFHRAYVLPLLTTAAVTVTVATSAAPSARTRCRRRGARWRPVVGVVLVMVVPLDVAVLVV